MCKEKYINPFTDYGFKMLFGTPKNRRFLIRFLNSLFDEEDKIVDINYGNVEKLGMRADERAAVFDLYCTTESGAHIIVEMQNCYQRFFIDRSIYYSTFPMHEAAHKGDWDFRLPKIYTVAFLNFRMSDYVDKPQYKHVVKLTDQVSGRVFYDKLTLVYLELPKFLKSVEELGDKAEEWIYVIKNINQLDEVPQRLRTEEFVEFFREAEIQGFTAEQRAAYEASLKSMRDYNNTISTAKDMARQEGLKEGRQEGLKEGRQEGLKEGLKEGLAKGREEGIEAGILRVAKSMKDKGISLDDIASFTGLSTSVIGSL